MIGTLYRTVIKPVVRAVTPNWVWRRYGDARWLWHAALPTDTAAAQVIGWPAVVALRLAGPRFVPRGRVRRLRLPGFPHPIHYRPGTSDPAVVVQVFAAHEYRCVTGEASVEYILDCGANIGLTALYLLHHYPRARAVVVEPDPDNMQVCRQNLAPFLDRVTFVQTGVWSSATPLVIERGGYCDGLDWAIQVRPARPDETADLHALTVPDLLDAGRFPRIDILKMDIEAAEATVFSGPCEWLNCTRTLVIELHGPACERAVMSAVAGRLALAGVSGELTVFRHRTAS